MRTKPRPWAVLGLFLLATGMLALPRAVAQAVPSISVSAFNPFRTTEGDVGRRSASFILRLSSSSSDPIRVRFATARGTASTGFIIGDRMVGDYLDNQGTVTFAPGQTAQFVTTSVGGDLDEEANETFFLDLSNPENATIATARATYVILNDDPSIRVEDPPRVAENEQSTTFKVSLSTSRFSKAVTVDFVTADGTAISTKCTPETPGVKVEICDYRPVSGALTFLPNTGLTTRSVRVPLVADSFDETDETLRLRLSNPRNVTLARREGVAVIGDDDHRLTVDDPRVVEGDEGSTKLFFAIRLTPRQDADVTARFATVSEVREGKPTALQGEDYFAASGTLTIPRGGELFGVRVIVNGDRKVEPDEQFFLRLSDPTNAAIADEGTGVITNDDSGDISGGIGIAQLAPRTARAEPGQRLDYALNWLHPTRWRDLDTLQLRIGDQEQTLLWAVFEEAEGTFRLLDPATGRLSRPARAGSRSSLETPRATLDASHSTVEGTGAQGPGVTVTFSVSLKRGVARGDYPVEVLATDDFRKQQGFDRVGRLVAVEADEDTSFVTWLVVALAGLAVVVAVAGGAILFRRKRPS